MRGKKKNPIEELETELEQFIANSGQNEDDIYSGNIAYCALKWRIDNPDSHHDDDDIWQMKDLHNVFLLGMAIHNRQNKINAACKVAAVTATAAAATTAATAAIATFNTTNTSISSSASTPINGNKITASFESTPPPSSDPSTTSSLPSSNDKIRASLDINSLSNQSSILASHSINKIAASFEANASFALSTSRSDVSNTSMVGAQSSKCPW
jgi:hypothetical protein